MLTAALLLTGKWFTALLQGAMLLFLLHSYSTRQHLVDATDVFRQLPAQKKVREGTGRTAVPVRRTSSSSHSPPGHKARGSTGRVPGAHGSGR